MPLDRPDPTVNVVPPQDGEDRYAALNDAAADTSGDWLLFARAGADLEAARRWVATLPHETAAAVGDAGELAVRRPAFETIGGFAEGVIAGAELDLCLRLREFGFTVIGEPELGDPRAAGWIGRRHAARLASRWRRLTADNRVAARRGPPERGGEQAVVYFTDAYPARSETFVYR